MSTVTAVPVEVKVEGGSSAIIMANVNDALLKFDMRWSWQPREIRGENGPEHSVEIRKVVDITDKEVNLESMKQLGVEVDTRKLTWKFLRSIAQFKKDEELERLNSMNKTYDEDVMHQHGAELKKLLPSEGNLSKTSRENYLNQNFSRGISLTYSYAYTDSNKVEHSFSFVIEQTTRGRYRYNTEQVFKIYDNASYGGMKGQPKKLETVARKIKDAISEHKAKIERKITAAKHEAEKLKNVKNVLGDEVMEYDEWQRGGRYGSGYTVKKLKSIKEHPRKGSEYTDETGAHFRSNHDGTEFTITRVVNSLNADQLKRVLEIIHETPSE